MLRKLNMSRRDILITFVTLHSIYTICSFACHFTHNTGKMCNNHAHLKKWKILLVDQPKTCHHEETYWIWKKKQQKNNNNKNTPQKTTTKKTTTTKKKNKKKNVIAWFELTTLPMTGYTKIQCICLCWGFTAQSTQWSHVERGQFTEPHVYWAGLPL